MLVRLQKFLADGGVASRRASEQIIAEGRVSVNGRVVRELGSRVDPAHDRVLVDGRPVRERRKIYVALNKPRGYICSRTDPESRKVISELLPAEWSGLHTVGRLDYNSEGLIFLTNDGDFSLRLTHPRYGVTKKYWVTVDGRVESHHLKAIVDGVFHEGERLKADRAHLLRSSSRHGLVEVELSEGRNREVRRLFETQGLTVERLQRVQIGRIKLGELPVGKWRVLRESEVATLLRPESELRRPRRSSDPEPSGERREQASGARRAAAAPRRPARNRPPAASRSPQGRVRPRR